jgi:hypothetical protein
MKVKYIFEKGGAKKASSEKKD